MHSAPETSSILLRDITRFDEIRAVEEMQRAVWGMDETAVVPLTQLVAALHVGGTLIGAFDGERMVGFTYGFYGHIAGVVVHHSHMLAVFPEYRNHNLGFRLKAEQRLRVLEDGITDLITWTFDPLQSINAHFNFNKLGVISDRYLVDVYSDDATSFLHQNGTDRLFVSWLLRSGRVDSIMNHDATSFGEGDFSDATRIVRRSDAGFPETGAEGQTDGPITIEIPSNISEVETGDPGLARKWREATRQAFLETLGRGYVVAAYRRLDPDTGSYLLKLNRLEDYK